MVERLRAIAGAVDVESATAFHFAGKRYAAETTSPVIHPHVDARQISRPSPDVPILSLLGETLYQRCYCARFDALLDEAQSSNEEWNADDATRFQHGLAEANTAQEAWDLGWHARELLPGGEVVAAKGDALRTFQAGEYLTTGTYGSGILPGRALRIPVPRDSWFAQPGYYYAFGSVVGDAEDDRDLVRVYWNVRASGSAALVRAVTSRLNRYTIPFKYKCPVHAAAYTRIDGNVLFIARRYYRLVAMLLASVYASVATHLDDDIPLFTHRLHSGLSVAEDPGTGESFGMHRMRLVANGLWAAYCTQTRPLDGRIRAIEAAFRATGHSLAEPHLKAGSRAVYTLPN